MNQKLMHMFAIPLLIAAVLMSAQSPLNAQTNASAQETLRRDQSYLRDLVSLSDIIGAAHAVRVRCNGEDDQYWRAYMIQILGLEAQFQGSLRSQMVSAFNRGFERESSNRIGCDASSNEREARYAVQGRGLAEGLAAHYFPERANGLEIIPEETAPTPRPGLRTRQ